MVNKKDLVDIVSYIYNKAEEDYENGLIEDWEQVFFNNLDKVLETNTEKVISHIFYADDDSMEDVAQGILTDLENETLLQSVCFDPNGDTTVVVMIVKK